LNNRLGINKVLTLVAYKVHVYTVDKMNLRRTQNTVTDDLHGSVGE
jgi:hypothetical protein